MIQVQKKNKSSQEMLAETDNSRLAVN